jgi:hypothetical protein
MVVGESASGLWMPTKKASADVDPHQLCWNL